MTKGCGQQGNDEVSDGIGGFVGLQTALFSRRHSRESGNPEHKI
ncbi:hypothetical protein [Neisseria uirgultaei]|nr:hypothetical protein [Neisseria uirgultaei]